MQKQPVAINTFMAARLNPRRESSCGEVDDRHPLPHIWQAIGHWIGNNIVPAHLGLMTLTHPAEQVVLARQVLNLAA